jgi:phage shock protein E
MRKSSKLSVGVVALALSATFLTGCSASSIDATKYDAIVDVRTPMEFADGHLRGAINIDVESPDFLATVEKLSKAGDYVVYCHTGRRAGIAIDEMKQDGFNGRLVNAGGYQDASAATGLAIVTN